MPISTRLATFDDLDLIAPLLDGYRQFYGQASDMDLARNFLGQRLSKQESIIFLGLDDTGHPLGFTQLFPSFSSVQARRIYILNDLFVAPSGRGRGVGALLLNAAAEFGRSQNAARLALSTEVSNKTAQRLYERKGWKRDEIYYYYNLTL